MTMAAAMTATVNTAAGITMAFRSHHGRRGGGRVSTGSRYAASRYTDRRTGYCPYAARSLGCLELLPAAALLTARRRGAGDTIRPSQPAFTEATSPARVPSP